MPERDPVDAYIALGANLGDAVATLRAAQAALGRLTGVDVVAASRLYRSAPLPASTGTTDEATGLGPDYVNGVVHLRTRLSAPELLQALLDLEQQFGRVRSPTLRYAPRTLDLDLLLYGSGQVHSPSLTVPHPRMAERAFVLVPLAELAPHLQVPGLGPVSRLAQAVAAQPLTLAPSPPS
jgi:2-amino-4-hydroxy-6-hydroxymethyldihydropteridine diphosphokinase